MVLVPIASSWPDSLNPTYGLDLSSRSGPPVKYQIIQTVQNITKIFMRIPIYVDSIQFLLFKYRQCRIYFRQKETSDEHAH